MHMQIHTHVLHAQTPTQTHAHAQVLTCTDLGKVPRAYINTEIHKRDQESESSRKRRERERDKAHALPLRKVPLRYSLRS